MEVSPNATPPVCRVIDYGKFIYERAKKEREAKRAQTKIEVKEIRLRPKTNEAHRGFKVDDARRWLLQGHKVRVTIKFRGREMDYPEIALEDLKEIAAGACRCKHGRTVPTNGRPYNARRAGSCKRHNQKEGKGRTALGSERNASPDVRQVPKMLNVRGSQEVPRFIVSCLNY